LAAVEPSNRAILSDRILLGDLSKESMVLTEFDQNTMANMTAALEYVCKQIPKDRDNHAIRKRIADAMVDSAKSGSRSYVDLQNAGTGVLAEALRPPGLGQLWSRLRAAFPWLRPD
jgi:hypothetical protein